MPLFVDPGDLHGLAAAQSLLFVISGGERDSHMAGDAPGAGVVADVEPFSRHITPVLVIELEEPSERATGGSDRPGPFSAPIVFFSADPDAAPARLTLLPSLAGPLAAAVYLTEPAHRGGGLGARTSAMVDAVREWMKGPWPRVTDPLVLDAAQTSADDARERLTVFLLDTYADAFRDMSARFAAESAHAARLRTMTGQAITSGERSAEVEGVLRWTIDELELELEEAQETIARMERSRTWRFSRPYRRWRAMLAGREVPTRDGA